jgi:hypothetical protein
MKMCVVSLFSVIALFLVLTAYNKAGDKAIAKARDKAGDEAYFEIRSRPFIARCTHCTFEVGGFRIGRCVHK